MGDDICCCISCRYYRCVTQATNDPFWSVAKNGVDKACKDMKVSCKYTAPATFDMVEMAKLIDNAVSQKPKGIVITLPDAAALGKSVKAAMSTGIQ